VANELILIVEDNPKNLKLVRDVLQVRGYRTIEAGTGEEGVQLGREQHPALVLMDIHLPGITGEEAFHQLRADPGTRAIPVIAVTASVMAHDQRRTRYGPTDPRQVDAVTPSENLAALRAGRLE
jgi:two-component system cell cycle response regulator DivK